MTLPPISHLVKKLKMKPLFGKDFLAEFHCSDQMIPKKLIGKRFDGDRPLFNWAYYLLPEGEVCPLHQLLADENIHYCLGGPLQLYFLDSSSAILS